MSKDSLEKAKRTDSAINVFDFSTTPFTQDDWKRSVAIIMLALRVTNIDEPFLRMIKARIIEENWTSERLFHCVNGFKNNHKFPSFTFAQFFEYDSHNEVFGKKWMMQEIQKDPNSVAKMDVYEIDGVRLYRYHDGKIFKHLKIVQINGKGYLSEIMQIKIDMSKLERECYEYSQEIEFYNEFLSLNTDEAKNLYVERLNAHTPVQLWHTVESYRVMAIQAVKYKTEKMNQTRLRYRKLENKLKDLNDTKVN